MLWVHLASHMRRLCIRVKLDPLKVLAGRKLDSLGCGGAKARL
jgi:hypothetical protein